MEPSYGFGSRIKLNTDKYIAKYLVMSLDLDHMNLKKKFFLI